MIENGSQKLSTCFIRGGNVTCRGLQLPALRHVGAYLDHDEVSEHVWWSLLFLTYLVSLRSCLLCKILWSWQWCPSHLYFMSYSCDVSSCLTADCSLLSLTYNPVSMLKSFRKWNYVSIVTCMPLAEQLLRSLWHMIFCGAQTSTPRHRILINAAEFCGATEMVLSCRKVQYLA